VLQNFGGFRARSRRTPSIPLATGPYKMENESRTTERGRLRLGHLPASKDLESVAVCVTVARYKTPANKPCATIAQQSAKGYVLGGD
jgi:hypothetical protein